MLNNQRDFKINEAIRNARKGIDILENEVKGVEENYNILVYGFGDLSLTLANYLAESNEDSFQGKLKNIYALGKKYETREENQKQRDKFQWVINEVNPQSPRLRLSQINYDDVPSYLNNVNLFILAASISKKKGDERLEMIGRNLELIDEIAPILNKTTEFKGHVHIVTNLPEILCYKLANETNLDPDRISGHGHIDKKRLDLNLFKYFEIQGMGNLKRNDAFCIGYHGYASPVLKNIKVDFGNGFLNLEELNKKVYENLQVKESEIEKFLKDYSDKEVELVETAGIDNEFKPTSYSVSNAIKEFIKAYIFSPKDLINASVFLDHFYSLAPTYLIGGRARPNRALWERVGEVYDQKKKKLEAILDEHGLNGDIRLNGIENKWEEGPIVEPLVPYSVPVKNEGELSGEKYGLEASHLKRYRKDMNEAIFEAVDKELIEHQRDFTKTVFDAVDDEIDKYEEDEPI